MDDCVYSQRCVSVDDYLSAPIPSLDHLTCPLSGIPIKKVPVLRVYGATQHGQKACIHIHRVYPYLVIPVLDIPQASQTEISEVFTELESSLNRSYGSSNGQFIHNITQMTGTPFYGFHESEVLFLKITFYQARYVKRTAQLLLQGALRGKAVQPHEAHFPYSLQFLTDYNIHGMNLIFFSRVLFRTSEDNYNQIKSDENTDYLAMEVDMLKVPQRHLVNPSLAVKKCSSALELDAGEDSVLNTRFIDVNCNPGLKAICDEERQRRHRAGNFTPLHKTATPVRIRSSLPESRKWEEKLENIIKNTSILSPTSLSYDEDVVNFLVSLDKSQPSQGPEKVSATQHSDPLRSSNNLSLLGHEDLSQGSNDEEVSVVMSQRVFYDDNKDEDNENEDVNAPVVQGSDEEFDDFTPSQLIQLDGNTDLKRSKRRLGGRPTKTTSHITSPMKRVLRSERNVTSRKSKCGTKNSVGGDAIPGPSKPETMSEFIDLTKQSNIDLPKSPEMKVSNKPSKVNVSSPDVKFSLDQFDDLRNTPHRSKTKRKMYKELNIVSPSSKPQKSKSLKHTRKQKETPSTPQKDPSSSTSIDKFSSIPKKLFNESHASPQTKVSRVSSDKEMSPISSFASSTSPGSDVSQELKGTEEQGKVLKGTEEQGKVLKGTEEQGKVLKWLSESECSQDGDESEQQSESVTESVQEVANRSLSFGDSFNYSPIPPSSLKSNQSSTSICLFDETTKEAEPQLPSVGPYMASHSNDDSAEKVKGLSSSPLNSSLDLSKLSIPSPVVLSSSSLILLESSQKEVVLTALTPSPVVLSGTSSLFSTPRNVELDSSMFYSQYQVLEDQQAGAGNVTVKYTGRPPSHSACAAYIEQAGPGEESIIQPHYSSVEDVPELSRGGGKHVTTKHISHLNKHLFYPECERDLGVLGIESWEELIDSKYIESNKRVVSVKYGKPPPTLSDVRAWFAEKKKSRTSSPDTPIKVVNTTTESPESLPVAACSTPISNKAPFSSLPDRFITPIPQKSHLTHFKKKVKFSPGSDTPKTPLNPTIYMNSQISNDSDNSSMKFALTVPVGDSTKSHLVQHLTVLSVETFALTVGEKCANPRYDPVVAVFYALYNDSKDGVVEGAIVVAPDCTPKHIPPQAVLVTSEHQLFEEFSEVVTTHDPDIMVGYEVKSGSVGYLIERGSEIGLNFQASISRFPDEVKESSEEVKESSEERVSSWWVTGTNEVQLTGRVIVNLWRLMKSELKLTNYSFQNIAYNVLHERLPRFPQPSLVALYKDPKLFSSFAEYFTTRSKGNIDILLDLNIIVRTSEMGRLFGIEFFNVLSRGTQYRVESMMTRLSKPLRYVSISPSPEQRAMMAAPELIPLVMEPESRFYGDPVVVLDFQSLYPTMIIAYNMCYSTCLGRVNSLGTYGSFPFGASTLSVPSSTLQKYQNHMFVSPNGVAFVEGSVRRGVLPMMLQEILETRIMVKAMMKQYKDDKALYRMLDARQMALKLIANVTYGYTSANFSGRMPCIEIGDSIVAKGRETLETAINLVNSTSRWGGRVVYGDTDSLFILFKGCTKAEAFIRGQEIADTVTAMNPKPVKLRLEKVYMPCVLQTKKRYVGVKYESVADPGEYEAKGIETVRRDGCPASVKTLKQALHILFKTHDISSVKAFVVNQFLKIIKNKVPVQDFIFAKEYRGKDSYRPGACVPALELAKRRLKKDPRSEPHVGERVQYVICYGTPGLPLIQLVHEPWELTCSNSLQLNTIYYITKAIIPPLQRVFGLMGANVMEWYNELPRNLRVHFLQPSTTSKHTLSHYYHSKHCPFCDKVSDNLCVCYRDQQKVGVLIHSHLSFLEAQLQSIYRICEDCSGLPAIVSNPHLPINRSCVNFVCPVSFKKIRILNQKSEKEYIKNDVYKLYNW